MTIPFGFSQAMKLAITMTKGRVNILTFFSFKIFSLLDAPHLNSSPSLSLLSSDYPSLLIPFSLYTFFPQERVSLAALAILELAL